MSPYKFLPFFLAISFIAILKCYSLECYSGYSIIRLDFLFLNKILLNKFFRGQSVSKKTEVCTKDSDQCYKVSLEASPANKLKKAGCSTILCMVIIFL